MTTIRLTDSLRAQYQRLFDTCVIETGHASEVKARISGIVAGRNRYASAAGQVIEEVRVAVVMHGGVSLAIYINGIAQESGAGNPRPT